MGRIATCTTLIKWVGPNWKSYTGQRHVLSWQGELTDLQRKASNELAQSLQQNRSHLVHAVCGAGKTELLFWPIFQALQRGSRVCVATPRTDVVLELYPRFQQAFANTEIHALYGGAQNPPTYAPLIVATTHQLYRFQHAFDVMIVDEDDALGVGIIY